MDNERVTQSRRMLLTAGSASNQSRLRSLEEGAQAGLVAVLVVTFALTLGLSDAEARSTDREERIVIEADAAEVDDRERVTIYRGDVIITQGTLRITGDTVWIYYDEGNSITKLVSVGKPAHFRQLPDKKDDYMTADAERMEYHADKDVVVMLGNARYGQGRDQISAERIVYDSLNGRMKAESRPPSQSDEPVTSEPKKKERVRITINPKKK